MCLSRLTAFVFVDLIGAFYVSSCEVRKRVFRGAQLVVSIIAQIGVLIFVTIILLVHSLQMISISLLVNQTLSVLQKLGDMRLAITISMLIFLLISTNILVR